MPAHQTGLEPALGAMLALVGVVLWAEDWLVRSDPVQSPTLVVGVHDDRDQLHYR